MIAMRDFGLIDKVNLNLDAAQRKDTGRVIYMAPKKNTLSDQDIFTHVNMQALEALGMESPPSVQLKFAVAPVVNPLKGESNWKVVIDPKATDRERSAILHATKNVQRIFDLIDNYQSVRALVV